MEPNFRKAAAHANAEITRTTALMTKGIVAFSEFVKSSHPEHI
jgi:hypothetical protein